MLPTRTALLVLEVSPQHQVLTAARDFAPPSVKRKTDDHLSYSEMVSKSASQLAVCDDSNQVLEQIGVNTAKVTSLCEKVKTELITLGAEPEICTIFTDLCEAINASMTLRLSLPSIS